jgi:hypothetical protein
MSFVHKKSPGNIEVLLKIAISEKRRKERQKYRKTERQKDRKTERQKDRKTERQKDRKTERQKDRILTKSKNLNFFFDLALISVV